MPLVKNLATQLDIEPADVSFHYFSWTGDQEGHKGFLPGHASWITGGSERIQQWLPQLKEPLQPDQRIAIIGWSNGGATAYELSCDLSRLNPGSVSLLITLDPVSWTTTPCEATKGEPQRVAKTWVNVYTRSTWVDRFKLSNIIALFGKAWDDNFPTVKADDLLLLEGSNHGDVLDMWSKKALKSEKFTQWK